MGFVIHHVAPWQTALAVLNLVTLLVAFVGCIALVTARAWGQRLPLSYVVYGWAVLMVTLVLPVHAATNNALYSLPRYLLVDFPICLAIAMLCAHRPHMRAAVNVGTVIAYVLLTLLQTAAFAIA